MKIALVERPPARNGEGVDAGEGEDRAGEVEFGQRLADSAAMHDQGPERLADGNIRRVVLVDGQPPPPYQGIYIFMFFMPTV